MWIFGYGSIIWRPGFEFESRRPGVIRGWSRRFWQGSTDNRGMPERPGRVVTLVEDPAAMCLGMAYEVTTAALAGILEGLDHRERGGYRRLDVDIQLRGSSAETVPGICYFADSSNHNFLGEATPETIAQQVVFSQGPSGPNVEYVVRLGESLRELGADDPHVFAVDEEVRYLLAPAVRDFRRRR